MGAYNDHVVQQLHESIANSEQKMYAKQSLVRVDCGTDRFNRKYIRMPELPTSMNPVWDKLEIGEVVEEHRPYLGYSQIGEECARYLWYSFRWAYRNVRTIQQARISRRGHQEEANIIEDLERAGIQCFDTLQNQIELVGIMGHAKGHPDGRCINVPGAEKTEHLLEMKSAKEQYFNQMFRVGCQQAQPTYFVQQQCYMGKTGLTRSLFVVTNKNNEARHYERIHYDEDVFNKAEERGFDIVVSVEPPPRLNEDPSWYKCKFCDAKEVCHFNAPAERNCRTCYHSKVLNNGQWGCSCPAFNTNKPVPVKFQRTGCKDHYKPRI